MKPRQYKLTFLIGFCILVGGLLAYAYRDMLSPKPEEKQKLNTSRSLRRAGKLKAHLYFLDDDERFLRAEERSLVTQDNAVERAKNIVYALIEGPQDGLSPAVPAEAKLLSLFVTEGGIAYVDFDRALRDQHPGGSLFELFTIYSIVNSLALNIPEIEAVKILIEGNEAKTLAGHIDIRFPFQPDILMIK